MMGPLEIKGVSAIFSGLLTGILLGIFLDKGRLTKHETIVGQFLLKDFTMLKVMLSALLAGSIGIHILSSANMVNLHISPFIPGKLLIGSALFGVGMAILGYWPGSGAGAVCTGKIDALVGILLGGITGTALYAAIYPLIKRIILQGSMFKSATISQLFNINHWIAIIFLSVMILAVFYLVKLLESKNIIQ